MTQKMISRNEIITYIENLLDLRSYSDSSYNGLQFEGADKITKIVTSVDASIDLFTKAKEEKANMVLVHHGLFWKGKELTRIDRCTRQILRVLDEANINLIALHLPLDAHNEYGNNAIICKLLGLSITGRFAEYHGQKIGYIGKFDKPIHITEFLNLCKQKIGKVQNHLNFGKDEIQNIGVVSGGGWDSVNDPMVYIGNVDLIITGEIIHPAYHACKIRKIHMVAFGHYQTEIFGVKALGEHLAQNFGVEHKFVDIPTNL